MRMVSKAPLTGGRRRRRRLDECGDCLLDLRAKIGRNGHLLGFQLGHQCPGSMQRAARQLRQQAIRFGTLHQRTGTQHELTVPGDFPGDVQIARFRDRSLQAQGVLGPAIAAVPGDTFKAGQIGLSDCGRE